MKKTSTGSGVAAMRAMENLMPEDRRIVADPYSEKFLTPFYKSLIILMRLPGMLNLMMKARERMTPGIIGEMICRTHYIDDVLSSAVRASAIAVVNLVAGMDTRAFRLPGTETVKYFEVDLPEVLEEKREYVNKNIVEFPSNLSLVPIDFNSQDLGEELEKAGYSLSSRTLLIWEGVTQYLSQEAIDSTLEYVAQASVGSSIVFTYVLRSFIDGSRIHIGLKNLRKLVLKEGDPLWFCGFEPAEMPGYLSKHSLHLAEDVGHEEFLEHYIKPNGRDLTVMEIEQVALAEVK